MRRAFVDANVLLRWLTDSPPEMAAQAGQLFEQADQGQVLLVLPDLVIAEVIWVLQSYYKIPKADIRREMQALIQHEGLVVQDRASLMLALQWYAEQNVDWVDAWLAVQMARQGVQDIYSFDQHFERLPGLTRRTPGT
jgi:predicted nucleic-acid-binding protein